MKKYQIIYADPPWDIGSYANMRKWPTQLTDKYQTMSLEELKKINVKSITASDCVCFMWVTLTTLPKGLELLKSWGFKYHITLTWDKGGGWSSVGFHRRTELVLVGFIGRITRIIKQLGKYIPTVFYEKKTYHSKKPEIMYRFLEDRTIGNKIELFARQKTEGWDVWGNEVESDIEL